MREKYIALPYCWVTDTSDILTLNVDTYAAMTRKINDSDLAKTHQEVISLARALNIRYACVDAICIIQGDAADWEREPKTMAQVYGYATLTVIAGRSADSRKGFITNNFDVERQPSALPTTGEQPSRLWEVDDRSTPIDAHRARFHARVVLPREAEVPTVCCVWRATARVPVRK
jgi:hypothetical protein